jgi:polysaccharide chain length determinant protein (PEP-CTERM system associated)
MDDLRSLVRRFIFMLWKRRWIALLVAWTLCVAGWFAVASIPNEYEASARVYVDADAVLTPLLRGLALDNSPASQVELLQHTLLSRPNLEKLISKTDLELSINGPTDLERAVFALAQAIRLSQQQQNLFTISYRNASPKLAYDVVQTMLNIFIESKTGNNRADMENADHFLEQQITLYEQKLRLAEAKRAEFRAKYIDLLPSDSTGLSRLEAARNTLATLEERLKDAQLHTDMLTKQLTLTPETIGGADIYTGGGQGNSQLAEAERRLAELRLKYTDAHPDVIAARQLVESLKAAPAASAPDAPRVLSGHTPGSSNPVYEQLKLQLYEGQGTVASLQRQIADGMTQRDELEAIAKGAPGLMAEYTDLNRDYDVLRKNHEELLQRRESMRIATAADTDAEKVKLNVVDPPQVPQIPVAPRRTLLDTAVLGLGMAGGIGVAMMLMQFDSSFQTIDELRRLELPVAGSISLITAVIPLHRRVLSVASFAMAVLLLCAVWGGLMFRMVHAGIA